MTTTKCKHCHRQSDRYLCEQCMDKAEDMLTGLADGWPIVSAHKEYRSGSYLEFLEDAILGQTRLGESARRSTERGSPMPVNLTASDALDNIHDMLTMWTVRLNTKAETLTDTKGAA
jgi:hypothetical protein